MMALEFLYRSEYSLLKVLYQLQDQGRPQLVELRADNVVIERPQPGHVTEMGSIKLQIRAIGFEKADLVLAVQSRQI